LVSNLFVSIVILSPGSIPYPVLIIPTMDKEKMPSGTFYPGPNRSGGRVDYILSAPGYHEFHVLYHGMEITHSPLKIEVFGGVTRSQPEAESIPAAPLSVSLPKENLPMVVKNSVNPGLAVVGNVFEFAISGDVEDPNDLKVHERKLTTDLLKTNVEHDIGDDPAPFTPNETGGTVTFPLKVSGPHKVCHFTLSGAHLLQFDVTYKGAPIKGSPVEVDVKPHPSTLISIVESSVHHDQAVVGKDFGFRIAGPIEVPTSVNVCNNFSRGLFAI
jgi:hypothetical protein